MFLDSSVLMAILLDEPEAAGIVRRLKEATKPLITSPIVRYEVVVSLARSRRAGSEVLAQDVEVATARFDGLLKLLSCTEVMITPNVARMAVEAAAKYGKVAGHPAKLNMGDCFSYATAKANRVALIYKGDDFAQTDLA